jgi:tetratricopeptide (TPR) repeat protein
MIELTEAIKTYAYDTQNPEKTYNLAMIYDRMGQTASAITFFMRAAERTEIKELAYECLIRLANCFDRQGNRRHTVTVMYKHAICLLQRRPEAYFLLSRLNERHQEYVDGYMYAQLGLSVSYFNLSPLRTDVGYSGMWGLTYEKAVCAWHWGRGDESRSLFKTLLDNDYKEMDEIHRNSVKSNLKNLGVQIE